MILPALMAFVIAGGIAAWAAERVSPSGPRWIALGVTTAGLLTTGALWARHGAGILGSGRGPWMEEFDVGWIPHLGIRFHLGIDGLSLVLLTLTFFLGAAAVLASWTEIRERVGMFHGALLWILAGIAGVFTALDLFLFYCAWELMLVPMYFLIALWGHERRFRAAVKFFLFTQISGLAMLVSILVLYFHHQMVTGVPSFAYADLLATPLSGRAAFWTMMGFCIAFAVKLPAVPFHTWLPDAHTQAPTAGSVILAGLLLKTGAYGLLRFVLPLYPGAVRELAPAALALAVLGILYGGVLAFAQRDLKRLVAYTSVAHMGFVLLGIFAGDPLALQGAVFLMVAHGISTGGLFVVAGLLQERLGTRQMGRMGGLQDGMPRLGALSTVLVLASIGLPGLADFVGEFLVLVGTYRTSPPAAVLGAVGVLVSTAYGTRLLRQVFRGPGVADRKPADLGPREALVLMVLAAALLWLGLQPKPVLGTSAPALEALRGSAPVEEGPP
ncbi:MAG: NADH-quinone oxidoreductase subunit M [Acidobacteriota bacterium]|jgi:NADH-quinone oxidoreductase subunit M